MESVNLFCHTAWMYDFDTRDVVSDDLPFYLSYGEQASRGVLELGCGTGRVALVLASYDYDVTGIDLSAQMLDVFRHKLQAEPDNVRSHVTLIHGTMADFSFNRKFGMIAAPFRAFQALTNEREITSCLACVRAHLDDDGIFILTAFRPYALLDQSWCYAEKIQWERTLSNGTRIVKFHRGDKIDTHCQLIFCHYRYLMTAPDESPQTAEDDIVLKYYYEDQLRELLESAQLSIAAAYGWYDKSAMQDGRELIFVCKKGEGNS